MHVPPSPSWRVTQQQPQSSQPHESRAQRRRPEQQRQAEQQQQVQARPPRFRLPVTLSGRSGRTAAAAAQGQLVAALRGAGHWRNRHRRQRRRGMRGHVVAACQWSLRSDRAVNVARFEQTVQAVTSSMVLAMPARPTRQTDDRRHHKYINKR